MIEGCDPYLCSVNIERDIDWVPPSQCINGWVSLGPFGVGHKYLGH